jgi:hypothetical protein
MIENNKPLMTEKEKIANMISSDEALILDMSGTTIQDVEKEKAIKEYNKEVDMYAERFNEHVKKLENYTEEIAKKADKIDIMPLNNYVLVKPFEQNPFQRIVKDKSGLITDLGGMAPIYKNTDSGEIEEEEAYVIVGVVQEVGPKCEYLQPSDTIMYAKPTAIPIPFYKQGLYRVCENNVIAVINEGLVERFERIKNSK